MSCRYKGCSVQITKVDQKWHFEVKDRNGEAFIAGSGLDNCEEATTTALFSIDQAISQEVANAINN